ERILGHAREWLATKMREHGIPARTVTPTELLLGDGGLLADDDGFPWSRMVTLAVDAGPPAGEVVDPPSPAAPAEPGPMAAPTAGPAAPEAGVPQPAAGDVAPRPDMPVEAEVDVRPRPGPPPPRATDPARGGLPTPDELIARVMGPTTYYLVDHGNRHATLRANGKHGWYYPTRYGGIRAVVLHHLPGGESADEVAAHLVQVEQPKAAHAVIDAPTILD